MIRKKWERQLRYYNALFAWCGMKKPYDVVLRPDPESIRLDNEVCEATSEVAASLRQTKERGE